MGLVLLTWQLVVVGRVGRGTVGSWLTGLAGGQVARGWWLADGGWLGARLAGVSLAWALVSASLTEGPTVGKRGAMAGRRFEGEGGGVVVVILFFRYRLANRSQCQLTTALLRCVGDV